MAGRGEQIDIAPPSGAFTESFYPAITDVAAADDGFVVTAYSMTDGIDGASAWWSPDGRRWESHSLGAGSRAATVIRTADGWMIGGSLERGRPAAGGDLDVARRAHLDAEPGRPGVRGRRAAQRPR